MIEGVDKLIELDEKQHKKETNNKWNQLINDRGGG